MYCQHGLYCADEVRLGVCGGAPIGRDCTGRDLACVEVGETGYENVRSENLSGTEGRKVCTLVVAVGLDSAQSRTRGNTRDDGGGAWYNLRGSLVGVR